MLKKKKLNNALKIVLSYLITILIAAILLCLPISSINGEWLPFIDSLFTSTSAVCVTGLTTVDIAVNFSTLGKLIVLILIQIGGLGLITLTALAFLRISLVTSLIST